MSHDRRGDGEKLELTLDGARDALSVLEPADRFMRVRVGESLKYEFGETAFDAWDGWYSQHDRYTAKEAKQAWKSFGKGGGGKPCTIGTLIYEAMRAGWKPGKQHQVKRSPEEKARIAAEREARRKALEAEALAEQAEAAAWALKVWEAADQDPAGHAYPKRKGVTPHGVRRATEWVKEWVEPDTSEVKVFRHADPLLVPMWSAPGKLASLQAIFPSKCIGRKPRDGERDERRDKDYLAGGRKHGCYFLFGRITKETTLVIFCEGWATGGSLHEATGLPVVVCFDAGNLEAVGVVLRGKLPGVRMLFAADNDQYHPPAKGNPGVALATKAAKAVDGIVAVPQFESLDGQPTDYNDLHARQGIDAVRAAIDLALNPPPAEADETPPWEDAPGQPPAEEATRPGVGKAPAAPPPAGDDGDDDGLPENNKHFAILGYDHERYFIFQHGKRQISTITKGDMGDKGLIELAPLNWWEMTFPGKNGIDTSAAANFLIRTAEKRGIYDISRIRGRGAWVDDGRMVYHHGSYLSVDGEPTDITRIKSRYVYELDRSLPDPAEEPMGSDEGEMILDVASRFRWTKPGSAALLAGWVALAPMCGALRWRPHLWVTGGAGSGKSTVLNEFAHHLLGGLDLFAQGSSSEAGIRQTLRADARPVLFDESESNEENDTRRIQNVLGLIRQASTESEAQTYKGTAGGDAMAFHIRSMFCLASIQVGIKQQADVERMAVLALRSKREQTDAAGGWTTLKGLLYSLQRDQTLPSRLFRRSLDLLPTTIKNIDVFTTAAAERFNSQRDGDQYGTLLAGAWSLISTGLATKEQALEMIDRYDWSEHRENNEMDEGQRALSALMEAHIKVNGGIEVTVYELICAASNQPTEGVNVNAGVADAFLQRSGMKIKGDRLLVSNTSNEVKRLMAGTSFEADLRGVLLRVEGADRYDNKPTKFNGVQSKCISLPIGPILGDEGRVAF